MNPTPRRRLAGVAALITVTMATIAACASGPSGLDETRGTVATLSPVRSVSAEQAPAQSLDLDTVRLAALAGWDSVLDRNVPVVKQVGSAKAIELAMRFTVTEPGQVFALRFWKGTGNAGPHRATLWAGQRKLTSARFTKETATGWQSVQLASAVNVAPGTTYTVSYSAPKGHWSLSASGFRKARGSGIVRAAVGAGRSGSLGQFPAARVGTRNFFVDVKARPSAPDNPAGGTLDLPRIAWEGGPAYWSQFPRARAGGWAKDTFFPIVVWFNGISSDAEAAYDKSVGINTYIGMYEGTDFSLFEDNDVFWIGDPLNRTFDQNSKNWVGDFLDDEVDGRFPPAEGLAHLQRLADERAGDGRFKYANFTQTIMSGDLDPSVANAYVNRFTDAVSMDMYWYTIPYCNWRPYRDVYITPVEQAYCRTASSYGKTIESLRKRDLTDNKPQAMWQFVEDLNGGPGEGPFLNNIAPGQVQGAVMSSVINEARGIVYFNQSLSGPCQTGSAVRQAQVNRTFCGKAQIAAVATVNNFIHSLAPVINTQSYVWDFGPGLDTMLKTYGNDAYVFSMVDGSSDPGSRTFTLPPGVKGRSVAVVGENRTLPVSASGTFTDTFAAEYSFHVYRVSI